MQFGPYTLLRKLAIGGMAEVHLAKETRQSGLERYVVIKRIHPHLAENSEFLRAFLQEGKLGAQLQHPNIAQVFDMGEQDGVYFLSLEYVRGVDLVQIFRRAQRKRHRMTRELILRIAIDVLKALDYAHEAKDIEGRPLRIIHRDVSPGNVLLGWDGTAKLVDFGIAKAASFDQHTRPGTIKGKIAYMAPEQILGDGPIDRRIDLFALGVILHELATGRRLFKADTEGRTMANVLGANIPALAELRPDLPAALCALVHKTLQRAPEQRFQSAADLLTETERVANETGGLQPVRAELSLLLRDEGEAEPEDPALAGLFVAPKAITSSWSVSAFDLPALGRGIFPPPKGPPGPGTSASGRVSAPPAAAAAVAAPIPSPRPNQPVTGPSFSDGFDDDGLAGVFQPEDFRLPDARESAAGLSEATRNEAETVDMFGSLDEPPPPPAAGGAPPPWAIPPPRSSSTGFDGDNDFAPPTPPSIQMIDPRQQQASPPGPGGNETSFADLLGDSSDRLTAPAIAARVAGLPPRSPALPLPVPAELPASGAGAIRMRDPAPPMGAMRLDPPVSRATLPPPPERPAPAPAQELGGVSLESREALLAAYAASTLEAARAAHGGDPHRLPPSMAPPPPADPMAGGLRGALGGGALGGGAIGAGLGALSGPPLSAGLGAVRPDAWKPTPAHGTPELPLKEAPSSMVRLPERARFTETEVPDSFLPAPDSAEAAEKKKPQKPSGLGRTLGLIVLALVVIGASGVLVAQRMGFGNAQAGLNALLEKIIPVRSGNPDGGPPPSPEVASAGVADAGTPEPAVAPGDAGAAAEPDRPATGPKGKPIAKVAGAAGTGPIGPPRNGTVRLEVSSSAEVDVDGQPGADAGLKVRNLSLAPGKHQIRVREPGISAERTLAVDVQAGRPQFRRIQFGRGTLKVTAAHGSSIRIDGRYIGRAPLDQMLLYEGPHSLEVEDPSNGVKTRREVRIQPGRTVAIGLGGPALRRPPAPAPAPAPPVAPPP